MLGDSWEKTDIRPVGKIGMTHDMEGRLRILARDKSGDIIGLCEAGEGRMEIWRIEEKDGVRADKSKGVHLALHRRDGKLAAFTVGEKGQCLGGWIRQQDRMGAIEWEDLTSISNGAFTVCERCTGAIEVFGTDFSGNPWHLWTNPQGQWSQWQTLGEYHAEEICVANNEEGFPEIFICDREGLVLTRRHHEDGMWGEWNILRKKGVQKIKSVQEKHGKIRLFVITAGGDVWTSLQEKAGVWGDWEKLSLENCRDMETTLDKNGNVEVLSVCYDGSIVRLVQEKDWKEEKIKGLAAQSAEVMLLSDGRRLYAALGEDGCMYMRTGGM